MTSCQRFSWRPDPGTLVWASSSTRTTWGGGRARRRGPSPRSESPVLDDPAGDDLEAVDQLLGARPPVGLDEADDHVGAPLLARWPSLSMA